MIREFNLSDRDKFYRFCEEFYNSSAVLHGINENNYRLTFDEIIAKSPYARGYMLETEGEIAGYALVSLTYSNEAGGLTVWAEEIYISPMFRGKGLGGEFFSFLEREFAGKVKRIRLEVTHTNERAVKLYKKHGFEDFDYKQMIKELN